MFDFMQLPTGDQFFKKTLELYCTDNFDTAKFCPLDYLLYYLADENAENNYKALSDAYAKSLLNPSAINNVDEYNKWKQEMKRLISNFTYLPNKFDVGGTWRPRNSYSDLCIYAGITRQEYNANSQRPPVIVAAILEDRQEQRGPNYEAEWNGFWHYANIMQFHTQFFPLTEIGLACADYVPLDFEETSAPEEHAENGNELSDAWKEALSLLVDEEVKAFAEKLMSKGVPAPDCIGEDIANHQGVVIGTPELTWTQAKVVLLLSNQAAEKETYIGSGFKVIMLNDDVDADIWKGDKA